MASNFRPFALGPGLDVSLVERLAFFRFRTQVGPGWLKLYSNFRARVQARSISSWHLSVDREGSQWSELLKHSAFLCYWLHPRGRCVASIQLDLFWSLRRGSPTWVTVSGQVSAKLPCLKKSCETSEENCKLTGAFCVKELMLCSPCW